MSGPPYENENRVDSECLSIRLNPFSVCFVTILIISLIARLYRLDERPLHHDESMLATLSWKLFEGKGYQYNFLDGIHGPVLFYLNAVIFFIFGVSDYTTRLGQALCGTGLVALVYSFRQYVTKAGLLIGASLFGLSPTFLYYTRFGKHDPFLIFFCVIFIAFFLRYYFQRSNVDLYGAAASLSLFFCTKAHAWLYFGIFVSFLGVLLCYKTLSSDDSRSSLRRNWQGFVDQIRKNRWPFALSLVVFWTINILLYSSFFTNWGPVLEGLYLPIKSSLGWHTQPRVWKAPFSYYLPLLVIYEIPIVVLVFYGLFRKLARKALSRCIFLGTFGLICVLASYLNQNLPKGLVPFIHVDTTGHVVIALYALIIGLWATFSYFKEGRTFRAFIVYWSTLAFVGYSSFGVKTPWFFIHILLPQVFLAAMFFGDFIESRFRRNHKILAGAFIVLLAILMLHNSILLNYYHAADARERLVVSQTSPEVVRIVKLIDDVAFRLGTGYDTPIAVQEIAAWPMAWYLRNYRNWYHPGTIGSKDRDKVIIIGDWKDRDKLRKVLLPDYMEIRCPLRSWWTPDTKDLNIQKLWRYFLYRKVFGPNGHVNLAVYVKNDKLPPNTGW